MDLEEPILGEHTDAAQIDFAIDHDSSGVVGVTGSGGRSKWGSAPPYRSTSSRPPWTTTTAYVVP